MVHMSSGWAALAAAWFLGPSAHAGEGVLEVKEPANVPIVILGTALLWMGWFGVSRWHVVVDYRTWLAWQRWCRVATSRG